MDNPSEIKKVMQCIAHRNQSHSCFQVPPEKKKSDGIETVALSYPGRDSEKKTLLFLIG